MRALVVGGEHRVLAHRQLAGGRVDIASWQAQHHAFYAEIAELGAAAGGADRSQPRCGNT